MSHHRRRHHRIKLKSLYVWHRYIGLAVALFVILLALTGVALNHTEGLRLDNRYVQSGWLLDWYGIEAPASAQHVRIADHALTRLDTQLYLHNTRIAGEHGNLVGGLDLQGMLVVGLEDGILLLTPAGEVIERLDSDDGVPLGIQRLGFSPDHAVILASRDELYVADADLVTWTHWNGSAEQVQWSSLETVDTGSLETLRQQFRTGILPWERVFLDLHSGRIFGAWGPWLMDLAAGLMVFLALSGILIWFKRKR